MRKKNRRKADQVETGSALVLGVYSGMASPGEHTTNGGEN